MSKGIFWSQGIFSKILNAKFGVKMNLRIISKNLADDPKIVFLKKLTSKPYCRVKAMPTALELKTMK